MTINLTPFSRFGRPGALSLLQRLKRFAVIVALVSYATPHLAAAADQFSAFAPPPCPDDLVDVHLSLWERVSETSTVPLIKLGPPQAHLRLPRKDLILIAEPSVRVSTTDCGQKSFTASSEVYLQTSRMARHLGIPYDEPRLQDDLIEFKALDPTITPPVPTALALVDDTADREGTARKGAWSVIQPSPHVYARFCLSSPTPADQCYARVGYSMAYKTGHLIIDARAFMHASLTASADQGSSLITIADLNHYFAFLRQIADAVVIPPSTPTK